MDGIQNSAKEALIQRLLSVTSPRLSGQAHGVCGLGGTGPFYRWRD